MSKADQKTAGAARSSDEDKDEQAEQKASSASTKQLSRTEARRDRGLRHDLREHAAKLVWTRSQNTHQTKLLARLL